MPTSTKSAKKVIATSPLEARRGIRAKVSLQQLPWCGKINLRGDPADPRWRDLVEKTLGLPLPVRANTVSLPPQTAAAPPCTRLFWLGPDEWLAYCDITRVGDLSAQLLQQLKATHHAVTDVSDYYAVLELRGPGAASVLSRGCPLDLHPRAFADGSCAQTRFGNASVLVYKPAAAPAFQLQVRWSYCDYVWEYLAQVINTP